MREFAVCAPVILALLGIAMNGCERSSSHQGLSRADRPTLTLAQLESMPDEEIEYAVFDTLLAAIGDDYERETEIVSAWSPGQQMLYTTIILEGEVNNGGFNQYFWNTEGKFADQALAGFRLVEAEQYAGILQRAIAVQKQEAPEMQKYKDRDTLEAFSESYEHTKLNKLDDEFYDSTEDLSALRTKYIRAHLREFVPN
jgi:hypothetical protein